MKVRVQDGFPLLSVSSHDFFISSVIGNQSLFLSHVSNESPPLSFWHDARGSSFFVLPPLNHMCVTVDSLLLQMTMMIGTGEREREKAGKKTMKQKDAEVDADSPGDDCRRRRCSCQLRHTNSTSHDSHASLACCLDAFLELQDLTTAAVSPLSSRRCSYSFSVWCVCVFSLCVCGFHVEAILSHSVASNFLLHGLAQRRGIMIATMTTTTTMR